MAYIAAIKPSEVHDNLVDRCINYINTSRFTIESDHWGNRVTSRVVYTYPLSNKMIAEIVNHFEAAGWKIKTDAGKGDATIFNLEYKLYTPPNGCDI